MANEKRLIDANALEVSIKFVKEKLSDGSDWIDGYACGLGGALDAIKEMPTIEAKPVVHGHWITHNKGQNNWCECSQCNTVGSPFWKRCPVCEAKMGGDGNG